MKTEDIRKDFPMLTKTMHGKPLIYFDTAATAQKPHQVIDTLSDFYLNHYGTVHRAIYDLAVYSTKAYEEARNTFQRFLNAPSREEIIFTRGTTESINLIATSFGKQFINPGDEILITEMEHHSNIVPWQMIAKEKKASLKVVPIHENGELDLAAYKKLLTPKTKIVSVTHVSNVLGTVNPIKKLIKLAHENHSKVLIDGAQAAPHIPINVKDLDCDFYVLSGHKLFGPNGIGVLYGKKELLDLMPPYQGGGDMIERVTFEKTTYNVLPLKFEAGTPIIAEAIALAKAVDYLEAIGLKNIQTYEHELLTYATEQLKKIPDLTIYGHAKEKGAIISFSIQGVHHLDLGTLLDFKGIAIRTGHHCAQPLMDRLKTTGTARISFAFYNTYKEVDDFIISLNEVLSSIKN
ncbi:cysteine desulfurase [Chlamydiales bacterium]|nr:cysteine desulfurase [Chlamydiales bacterium]